MLFFIKPSVIHLDCFTNRPDVYEYFPVNHTAKFLPSWWKNLPAVIDNKNVPYIEPTMRSCVGFNLFHQHGITIPLWSDFSFLKFDNGAYQYDFSDSRTQVETHDFSQMQGYLDPNDYVHLKIISPWIFSTKKYIKWAWVQNTWNLPELSQIFVPPAVMDFKHNNFTHINMFVNIGTMKSNKFLIESGTSMVNLIPLTDKKVKIHNHYDPDKFFLMAERGNRFSYTNVYSKRKRMINQKKCPFGF